MYCDLIMIGGLEEVVPAEPNKEKPDWLKEGF
jgi:hypothetical protein